ncbi:hypothetical protein [Streptomyces decoyicus]|nr:hypothetical protein OG532_30940 [Streptomyces decoyicus]
MSAQGAMVGIRSVRKSFGSLAVCPSPCRAGSGTASSTDPSKG